MRSHAPSIHSHHLSAIAVLGLFALACAAASCSSSNTEESPWSKTTRACVESPTMENDDKGDIDPEVLTTVTGTNGSFTDECDANGNLIEYICTQELRCDASGACDGWWTGEVMPQLFECNGKCQQGGCELGCPGMNDQIEVLSVVLPKDMTLRDSTNGFDYSCTFFDNGSCSASLPVGSKGKVSVVHPSFCTEGDGFFGVQFDTIYCPFDQCKRMN